MYLIYSQYSDILTYYSYNTWLRLRCTNGKANRVDPDQTTPLETVLFVSSLFAQTLLPEYLRQNIEYILFLFNYNHGFIWRLVVDMWVCVPCVQIRTSMRHYQNSCAKKSRRTANASARNKFH